MAQFGSIETEPAKITLVRMRPVNRRRRQLISAFFLLSPLVVLLLVFLGWPIVWTVFLSFTNMELTGVTATHWSLVGLQNYAQLFRSHDFFKSIWLSIVYLFGSAYLGQTLLGFVLALLFLRRSRWIRSLVGGIVILAWVVPEIVASYMWYAFLADGGVLHHTLSSLHVPYHTWLLSHPMLSVSLANSWRGVAFSMMLFSAALSNIPPELIEVADVDGASNWWKITRVMIPLISHSILVDLVLVTLGTLNNFTLIYALTGGGPGTNSQVLSLFMYQKAFGDYQLAYGSAISVVLLMVGVVLSIIYVRLLKTESQEQPS